MTVKRYQKGHASILFAMVIPVLFGVFMLGSDGARALQQKARLQDATEAAALAISAHADQNESEGEGNLGSEVNRKIATDFISAYFPEEKINTPADLSNLKIIRKSCEQVPDCTPDGHRFFQYDIQVSLKYDAWFPGNDVIVGFGDEIEVAGASTARKYQSNSIDVVLAADFSGSMDKPWGGGSRAKYKDLLDIIEDVAIELDNFNDLKIPDKINTIGIAPYSHYARRKEDKKNCPQNYTVINGIGNVEHLRFNYNNGQVNYLNTIYDLKSMSYANDSRCAVDTSNTRGANFYSISLTDDILPGNSNNAFTSQIKKFKPLGGTASYLGLIEAYKILKTGSNKKKLLVILSDGVDSAEHTPIGQKGPQGTRYSSRTYETIGKKLVMENGLCEIIKNDLSENGIETTMYVIGFDYEQGDTNIALDRCVGPDNVLYAENKQEILNKILSLIAEEIGHLK
ncbi:TadG [Vibrio sinensis]|uniref:TadG n=1 Tax=Vibrio sinensis TaxID=2302434 RepID=A0A3A6QZ23_9VIBR|nr:pilus assembly protein TadG-related protein [Vibrio sinensis]RJX68437.1 TadG [Vibrio sinensis]